MSIYKKAAKTAPAPMRATEPVFIGPATLEVALPLPEAPAVPLGVPFELEPVLEPELEPELVPVADEDRVLELLMTLV